MMSRIFAFNHEHPELSLSETMAELCRLLQIDEARFAQRQPQGPGQQVFNPAQAAMAQHHQQQLHQMQQAQLQHQQAGQFLSPAQAANLNLPNAMNQASPGMMSNHPTPAMQNLALQQQHQQQVQGAMGAPIPPSSVPMAHQASYQGTNPSAAATPAAGSANASPNVNVPGKRSRGSGVNLGVGEDGMDGPQMNGIGPAGGAAGSAATGGPPTGTGKAPKQSPRVGGGGVKRQKPNA